MVKELPEEHSDYFHAPNGDVVEFLPDEDGRILSFHEMALSLSKQCRYNGHTPFHYSVAKHSILVSHRVADMTIGTGLSDRLVRALALAGLMHDCGEAIIGDIISPVKRRLPDEFAMVEEVGALRMWQKAVKQHRALSKALHGHPLHHPLIKRADRDLLTTEFVAFFEVPVAMALRYGGEYLPDLHMTHLVSETTWAEDYARFFSRFGELGGTPW